ncbi:palmitoyltransferase ZDHHC23-A isoform X4 [Pseudorasbora parva]|uniref:palmitoyltransferase ZDHHC23-A isoform X4 n=1 Tax=Pseudorasbora parva TaxID=51549 RepID=UPI00351E3A96
MKRERFKPPQPDDPLCCCGDIDQQREYCCCEELDDACERLLRGEPDKPDIFSRFISRTADRLGLPCSAIGPLRLELSVLPPMGPGVVKSQSLALGIHSSSTTNQNTDLPRDSAPCNGIGQSKGEKEGKKTLCPVCRLVRPPRAGHCRICGACVLRMDHHCVWINSCVGQANHRQFILTLLLFLLTSFYGISLVLRSICPRQSLFTAMLYCPGVYNQYSTALCFTCVWYSVIITGGLLHLFILQIINVSYNVTEREAQIALRNKTGRRRYCGLVVETGVYSRGFLQNWIQFLTMNTDENASPFSFTDMKTNEHQKGSKQH